MKNSTGRIISILIFLGLIFACQFGCCYPMHPLNEPGNVPEDYRLHEISNASQEVLSLVKKVPETERSAYSTFDQNTEKAFHSLPVLRNPRFPEALRLYFLMYEYKGSYLRTFTGTNLFFSHANVYRNEDLLSLGEYLFTYGYQSSYDAILDYYYALCRHFGTKFVFSWLDKLSETHEIVLPRIFIEDFFPPAVETQILRIVSKTRKGKAPRDGYFWHILPLISKKHLQKWYEETEDYRFATELLRRGEMSVLEDNAFLAELHSRSRRKYWRHPLGLGCLFDIHERFKKSNMYGKVILNALNDLQINSLEEFPSKFLASMNPKIQSFSYIYENSIREVLNGLHDSESTFIASSGSCLGRPSFNYHRFADDCVFRNFIRDSCDVAFLLLEKSASSSASTLDSILFNNKRREFSYNAVPSMYSFISEIVHQGFFPVKMRLLRLGYARYNSKIEEVYLDSPDVNILCFMKYYRDVLIWNPDEFSYQWAEGFDISTGEK